MNFRWVCVGAPDGEYSSQQSLGTRARHVNSQRSSEHLHAVAP
jgi:hypothetical protein